jgi:hypothetical protein
VESESLLKLLEQQAKLYRELRGLANRQRPLITRGQTAPLLTLLADRQRLSGELSRVAAELTPYRADWQRVRARLSEIQRRRAEVLLGEVETVMRDLLQVDEADARLLAAQKVTTQRAINDLRVGHQALSAYQPSIGPADANDSGFSTQRAALMDEQA